MAIDFTLYLTGKRRPAVAELRAALEARGLHWVPTAVGLDGHDTVLDGARPLLGSHFDLRATRSRDAFEVRFDAVTDGDDEHYAATAPRGSPAFEAIRSVATLTPRGLDDVESLVLVVADLVGGEGVLVGSDDGCTVASLRRRHAAGTEVDVLLRLHGTAERREYALELTRRDPHLSGAARIIGDRLAIDIGPPGLSKADADSAFRTLLECAGYADDGYVRFGNGGEWRDVVKGIGALVEEPPEEWLDRRRRSGRGWLRRLLGV